MRRTTLGKKLLSVLLALCMVVSVWVVFPVVTAAESSPTQKDYALASGEDFHRILSDAVSAAGVSLARVVFDFWGETTQAVVGDNWYAGTDISANGNGRVRVFVMSDGTAYILGKYEKQYIDMNNIFSSSSNYAPPVYAAFFPEDASGMFEGYTDLKEVLGIEKMGIGDLEYANRMFKNCTSLEGFTGFVNSAVSFNPSHCEEMFMNCTALKEIRMVETLRETFGSWSSIHATRMFFGCTSLTEVETNFVFDSCAEMFSGCESLEKVTLPNQRHSFGDSSDGGFSFMFYGCSALKEAPIVGLRVWNEALSAQSMFEGCTSLTSVEAVGEFNDSAYNYERNLSRMFAGCTALETVTFPPFFRSTNASEMFLGCTSLTGVDLTGYSLTYYNGAYNADLHGMFSGCSALSIVAVADDWAPDSEKVNGTDMFLGCTALVGEQGTAYAGENVGLAYARVDGGTEAPGYFSSAAVVTLPDGETFNETFVTDDLTAIVIDAWNSDHAEDFTWENGTPADRAGSGVALRVFTDNGTLYLLSRTGTVDLPEDATDLFRGFAGTKITGLGRVNAYKTQKFDGMFRDCAGVTELDLSGWNVFNGKTFGYMFAGCELLESVDLSVVKGANGATDISHMFDGCASLTDIVENGTAFIYNFGSSGDIDRTKNTAAYMFAGCSSLKSFDMESVVSDFNCCYNVDGFFSGCTSLEEVYDNGSDHSWFLNHGSAAYVFENCSSLRRITLEDEDAKWEAEVSSLRGFFKGCTSLTELDLHSIFGTDSFSETFYGQDIGTLDLAEMFDGCENLTSVSLISFGIYAVTDTSRMFAGCSSLTELDLGTLGTAATTDMSEMFLDDTSLKTVYVSNKWSTAAVTGSTDMFKGCSVLTGAADTGYSSEHTDVTYAVVDGGTEAPGYFSAYPTGWLLPGPDVHAVWPAKSVRKIVFDVWDGEVDYTAEPYNFVPANGTDISWTQDGSVTVFTSGYGDTYTAYILSTEEKVVANPDSSYLFADLDECLRIENPEMLDTSHVTNMSHMFEGIGQNADRSATVELDLSSLDVSNVTDMSYMFAEAGDIVYNPSQRVFYGSSIALDITGWDTSSVTDMSHMFENCHAESGLDLSALDTQNVTDMSCMFYGCNVPSFDFTGWDTSSVTDMTEMFALLCHSVDLDLSDWDVSAVESMSGMFAYTGALWSIEKFRGTLDLSGWDLESCWDTSAMFAAGMWSSIKLDGWQTPVLEDMTMMFTFTPLLSALDVSSFDTSNVISMAGTFAVSGVTHLDLTDWDTSAVRYMSIPVDGQIVIGDRGVSKALDGDTAGQFAKLYATMFTGETIGMFGCCPNLQTIYASELWSLEDVEYSEGMFVGDSNLKGKKGTEFDPCCTDASYARVDRGAGSPGYFFDDIFKYNTPLMSGEDFNKTLSDEYGAENIGLILFGTWDDYGEMLNEQFGVDWDKDYIDVTENGDGYTRAFYLEEYGYVAVLSYGTEVTLNEDCSEMFAGFTNLQELPDFGAAVNMRPVTDMSGMFRDCASLNDVDFDESDTRNVTDMHEMFAGCAKLDDPDLNELDTSSVTDMSGMFKGCTKMEDLDLGDLDTSSVTDMSEMFSGCKYLYDLDVSGFDTSSVTDMHDMFAGCTDIYELELGSFDPSSVTDMSGMFKNCKNLRHIQVNADVWTTDSVTSSEDMFLGCTEVRGSEGTEYDSNHTDKEYARVDGGTEAPGYLEDNSAQYNSELKNGYELNDLWGSSGAKHVVFSPYRPYMTKYPDWSAGTSLAAYYYQEDNIRGFFDEDTDTIYVLTKGNKFYEYNAANMFQGMDELLSVEGLRYLENVSTIDYMFDGCEKLETADLSHTGWWINTMNCAFRDCKALQALDVSGWNTESFYGADSAFENCASLTELDVSDWDTQYLSNTQRMFYGCEKLASLDVSDWNTQAFGDISGMFAFCSSLETLNVADWNVSQVYNMSMAFMGCSSLQELDLSDWTPTNLNGNFNAVFAMCSSLKELDVADWNMKNVQNMSAVFAMCSSLEELDVSGWNTMNVNDMSQLFAGCSALTALDLSDWNTVSATDMSEMFEMCSSLEELDLSGFTTSNVQDMSYMFALCEGLEELDLTAFLGNGVVNADGMFVGCKNLADLRFSHVTMYNLQTAAYMFAGCECLEEIDISHWNTHGNLSDVHGMFATVVPKVEAVGSPSQLGWDENSGNFEFDTSLQTVKIGDLYIYSDADASGMFAGCDQLTTIYANTDFYEYIPSTDMFLGCDALVGGNGTAYSADHKDASYARVDKNGSAGYFTQMYEDTLPVCTNFMGTLYNRHGAMTEITFAPWDENNEQGFVWEDGLNFTYMNTSYEHTAAIRSFAKGSHVYILWQGGEKVHLAPDGSSLFNYCSYGVGLTAIHGLDNLDTSYLYRTEYMFSECGSLTEVDLSSWDLSGVVSMYSMFAGCSELKSVSLPASTATVTTMQRMFRDCTALESFSWDAPRSNSLQEVEEMFYGCDSLASVSLTDWRNPALTDMYRLFADCVSLTSVDVNSFGTARVNEMTLVFYNCLALETLDLSGWDVSSVNYFRSMFNNCRKLSSLDLTGWANISCASDFSYMFCYCTSLSSLDLSGIKVYGDCAYMFAMMSALEEVTWYDMSDNWTWINNASYMFAGCVKLTDEDLPEFTDRWNMSNMNDASYMFAGCVGLTKIDLSKTNFGQTGNLTNTSYMFAMSVPKQLLDPEAEADEVFSLGTSALKTVNLRNCNTACVTDMTAMFRDCGALQIVIVSSDWSTDAVEAGKDANMFLGCKSIEGQCGTEFDEDVIDRTYARVDYGEPAGYLWDFDPNGNTKIIQGSEFKDKIQSAVTVTFGSLADYDEGTFTWSSGEDISADYSGSVRLFNDGCGNYYVLTFAGAPVMFNEDSSNMFNWCTSLTAINGLETVDTSAVTSMSWMFTSTYALTGELDIGGWDVSNVTNMSSMFYQSGITVLGDLSGWNVSNVENASSMFAYSSLTGTLNLSGWKWEKVNSLDSMFEDTDLIELNLSNWQFGSGTYSDDDYLDISFMLERSTSLKKVNITGWNSVCVTKMTGMFRNCEKLEEIVGLGDLDTANVQSIHSMFDGCTKLAKLDLSHFVTSKVDDMREMFRECESLTELDLSSFDTSAVWDMSNMFMGCTSLTTLTFGDNWDVSHVVSFELMFTLCRSLTDLDVSDWDTSSAICMDFMFAAMQSVRKLDVKNFDVSHVLTAQLMFAGCASLTSLDLSGWDWAMTAPDIWSGDEKGLEEYKEMKEEIFEDTLGVNLMGFAAMTVLNVMLPDDGDDDDKDKEEDEEEIDPFGVAMDFSEYAQMQWIDLSGWDHVENIGINAAMFYGNKELRRVFADPDMAFNNATVHAVGADILMFSGCDKLEGGCGFAVKDAETYDSTYANVNTDSTDGYFTNKLTAVIETEYMNLALDGQIGVMFYVTKSEKDDVLTYFGYDIEEGGDNPSGVKLCFRIGDEIVTRDIVADGTPAVIGGKEVVQFVLPVDADKMCEKITVYFGDEAGVPLSYAEKTTSVYEYAEYILDEENKDSMIVSGQIAGKDLKMSYNDYANLCALAKAMLNYGTAAEIYNGTGDEEARPNSTSYMSDADRTIVVKTAADFDDHNSFLSVTKDDSCGIALRGFALDLTAATGIRVYFEVTDPELVEGEDYTCTFTEIVTAKSGSLYLVEEEATSTFDEDSGYNYVELKVPAAFLSKTYEFRIGEDTVLQLSAMTYARLALEEEGVDEDLARLLSALYDYNVAAKAYFGVTDR